MKNTITTTRLRKYRTLLDKAVLYEWLARLEGRFWGLAAIWGLGIGLTICFLLSQRAFTAADALSDFGNSIRSAPYFAGSLFFASYGLWRWRKYAVIRHRNSVGIEILFSQTIVSMVLVALMPYSWHPWPYRIHMAAVTVLGISIVLTVLVDTLLTTTPQKMHALWRTARALSLVIVMAGCTIIFASSTQVGWLHLTLLGEIALLQGYGLWIIVKTFANVDEPSKLSSVLRRGAHV